MREGGLNPGRRGSTEVKSFGPGQGFVADVAKKFEYRAGTPPREDTPARESEGLTVASASRASLVSSLAVAAGLE